ncbi:polysaccharide deacetylase [Limoniibacter endophyticus]|uniref:Polysaccharide deacetylase n=2 Tax=Limoniibacter endophyticus TaxID=1565040 RepID=A0A8J3DH66_9HYPH|nr:polysaccharide deacetylase [Limoniibacter endophyticus]
MLALPFPAYAEAKQEKPQYVIISFDGAHDLRQWRRSADLGRETGASFTYFQSCVFLLSPDTRNEYARIPGEKARSNVGFALSKQEVADRLAAIWSAHQAGHEIASHGCGHFDGTKWTKATWDKEFSEFSRILTHAYEINGIEGEPNGWKEMARSVIGFRAPYLAMSPALNAAQRQAGLQYDASTVSRGPLEPHVKKDIMQFSLPLIPEGPSKRLVIGMDYNLYVRHSGGKERPEEAAIYEARAYEAFKTTFDTQYSGERIPLQFGFHFTLMNDGAYWRALEHFAREVCRQKEVRCVSYRTYLEETAAPDESHAG